MTNKFKTLLAIATLTLCSIAQAKENISIVWGFNIGSNQATTLRHLIDEANRIQTKYTFVLESKPGAGGSIAANHVLQNPNNTLVGMSSSFFIRPAVETTGVHDLDKFKTVVVQGTSAPLVIVSKKYNSVGELLAQPNPSLGISGIGSMSDMLASILAEKNTKVNPVNFKGMVDATVAAAGGHVDAAVTFAIDAKPMIDANEVKIIGYTGSKELKQLKSNRMSTQGITDASNLVANYAIFASQEMDANKTKELHEILTKASNNDKVIDGYAKDLITPVSVPFDKLSGWYNNERQYWKSMASKLPKK